MDKQEFINKKAYFDYEVLETFEAGIKLVGPEVKSIRRGQAQLKGNFVSEWKGELFVEGMYITPYKNATLEQVDPRRKRKLLLRKKQIVSIAEKLKEKGLTATVLELYFKNNLLKCKLGIVRGKKKYDKRESIKKKEQDRIIKRAIKNFS